MSRTLLALAMAGLGSLFATGLHGQFPPPLATGQTVRITKENGFRRTGVLREITSDSLTIEIGKGAWPRTYALADLRTIEEKTGTFLSARRTLLVTVGVTALAGAVIGAVTYEPSLGPRSRGRAFAWGAAEGAVVGLFLGLVLTPIVRYDRWERVPVPESLPRVGLGLAFKIPLPAR